MNGVYKFPLSFESTRGMIGGSPMIYEIGASLMGRKYDVRNPKRRGESSSFAQLTTLFRSLKVHIMDSLPAPVQHESPSKHRRRSTLRRLSTILPKLFMIHTEPEIDTSDIPTWIPPENLDVLCSTTNFSRKELQFLYRNFKNHSHRGYISLERFKMIFGHFFSRGDSSGYAALVFNAFDVDRDGNLTFQEFVDVSSKLLRGSTEEKLEWIFRLYDVDDKGYLSENDLENVVNCIFHLSGNMPDDCQMQRALVKNTVTNLFRNIVHR
uniref:EF-hand domain-containing protein n=1 Tax=Romanomermis culicivorax TaxID=13658 RepID=A0A915IE44_ROMCU